MKLSSLFFLIICGVTSPLSAQDEITTDPESTSGVNEEVVELPVPVENPMGGIFLRLNHNRQTGLPETEPDLFNSAKWDLWQMSPNQRWLFETGGYYTEFGEPLWLRDQTRVSYRRPDKEWVITAGDFAPSFRGFQQSALVMGLSWKSGQSTDNDRTSFRKSTTEIQLSGAATVEILLGEQLFTQFRQESGIIDLREYPLLRNRKEIVVRIRDDFGQEDVYRIDLFSEVDVLSEGRSDFSYQVGALSIDEPGDRAYEGDRAMAVLHYRKGLSSRLTGGVNYQNLGYRHLIGAELSTEQDLGLFSLDVGGTEVLGTQGFAARLRWKSLQEKTGFVSEWILEERTEFFIPIRPENLVIESFRRRFDISISKPAGNNMLVGIGGAYDEAFPLDPSRRVLRLDWAYLAQTNWSIEGTAYQQQHFDPEHGLRVSIAWREAPKALSLSAFHDNTAHTTNLRLERPDQENPRDGFVRVNDLRWPDQEQVDVKAALWNDWGRIRLQSFEDEVQTGGSESLSAIGFDTSLIWGAEGLQFRPPPQ